MNNAWLSFENIKFFKSDESKKTNEFDEGAFYIPIVSNTYQDNGSDIF